MVIFGGKIEVSLFGIFIAFDYKLKYGKVYFNTSAFH